MIQAVIPTVSADHLNLLEFTDSCRNGKIIVFGINSEHVLPQEVIDPVSNNNGNIDEWLLDIPTEQEDKYLLEIMLYLASGYSPIASHCAHLASLDGASPNALDIIAVKADYVNIINPFCENMFQKYNNRQ